MQETKSIWIASICWMLSSHLIVLWRMMLWDIKRADGALWCSPSYDGVGGFVYSSGWLRGCEAGWGEKWGAYGGGGKERGKVLMGKRRMACQCQKWSCAEERVGENEREDGRRAWLINLFTSLKMLQAPFWLKFSLSSIIAMAGLNLQSCRYQTLSKRSSLQPESPPRPPTANLILTTSAFICMLSLFVSSWLVGYPPPYDSVLSLTHSVSHMLSLYVCPFIYSSHSASKPLALKTHWEMCLCVSACFLQWCAFPTQSF